LRLDGAGKTIMLGSEFDLLQDEENGVLSDVSIEF
jgi:hypothetical protein